MALGFGLGLIEGEGGGGGCGEESAADGALAGGETRDFDDEIRREGGQDESKEEKEGAQHDFVDSVYFKIAAWVDSVNQKSWRARGGVICKIVGLPE